MSMKENPCAFKSTKTVIPSGNEKPRVRKSSGVLGSIERKRLANITNMQQQPTMSMLDEKSQFIPASTKEYIEKLKKENVTLMKLLADRNKIIELSGNELHKLRVTVQKLQQQNLQLAQSNSQMLAELTVDKDRLKLLQHELGCKNGLLVAKGLELKEKDETLPSQKVDGEGEVKMLNEKLDSSQASIDNVKPINKNRRQLSKSLGPSIVKESKDKKADNKRQCVRRQSARLQSQESEPATDVSEVETNSLAFGPPHSNLVKVDFSKSSTTAINEERNSGNRRLSARRQSTRVKSEEPEPDKALSEINSNDYKHNDVSTPACLSDEKDSIEGKHALNCESQDFGRPSLGRPSRQAAMKVNSYKEVPLNVKMRRSE